MISLKELSLKLSHCIPAPKGKFTLFGGKVLINGFGNAYIGTVDRYLSYKAWMTVSTRINMWDLGLGFNWYWQLVPQLSISILFFHLVIAVHSNYWSLERKERFIR